MTKHGIPLAVLGAHTLLLVLLFAWDLDVILPPSSTTLLVQTVQLRPRLSTQTATKPPPPLPSTVPDNSIAQGTTISAPAPPLPPPPPPPEPKKTEIKPAPKPTHHKPTPHPKPAPKKPLPEKKPEPKPQATPKPLATTSPPKPPPPPPQEIAEQQRRANLVAQAKERLNQVGKTAPQSSSSELTALFSSNKALETLESLHATSLTVETNSPLTVGQMSYRDELAHRLKLGLKLPEYGDVRLQLTVHRSGRIVRVRVERSASSLNRTYVEKTLPDLKMAPFGESFGTIEEFTFTITLTTS